MAAPPLMEATQSSVKSNGICQVCGDAASIINYGALTCPSCRTFFRRNGFPNKDVPTCRYGGHCEMTTLNRKRCAACRLAKCLVVGMSPDLIRKQDLSRAKRKYTESNEEVLQYQPVMTISRISTLNLPVGDSSLSSTDWNIISNVVHAFDAFSPVSDVRRTIEAINASTSNVQFDASQSLRMLSSFCNSLQLFICSTPDFQVLTTDEQWSLFQRNMPGLLSIGGVYLMREAGIFDTPENERAVLPLYGNDVVQQVRTLSIQLDRDPIPIKLMLLALAFSSNCFIGHHRRNADRDSLLLGTFRLFGSQNVYVELMWKYLIHRYNHDEAVQRFSLLIKRLLDTLKLSIEIYENNQIFRAFIDDLIEQIQQSPVINAKTIIPLWGKS